MEHPSLLMRGNRGKLLEKSRESVHDEGYSYKKGKSRAKRLYSSSSSDTPKRKKMNASMRTDVIRELEEDKKDIERQILVKEKRRDQAESVRNYKLCDEIMNEISKLKTVLREKTHQLKLLLQKESKSKWYHKRKPSHTGGSTSDTDKESDTSGSAVAEGRTDVAHTFSPPTTPFTCRSPSPLFVPAKVIDLSQSFEETTGDQASVVSTCQRVLPDNTDMSHSLTESDQYFSQSLPVKVSQGGN